MSHRRARRVARLPSLVTPRWGGGVARGCDGVGELPDDCGGGGEFLVAEVLRRPVHERAEWGEERYGKAEGLVVLRYVAATERSPFQPNPNGSTNHIAGICNAAGNIVGIMPHPERAIDRLLGLTGGAGFFSSPISSHQNAASARTQA